MSENFLSGGCLCGAVRYEVAGKPRDITHCHCVDCRRSSGAPFVTWATFRRSDFRFIKGEPRDVHWAGRVRSFCPQCGTQLVFATDRAAAEVDVTVCSFDHPETISPDDHTWTEDRLPWIRLADDRPTFRKARSS